MPSSDTTSCSFCISTGVVAGLAQFLFWNNELQIITVCQLNYWSQGVKINQVFVTATFLFGHKHFASKKVCKPVSSKNKGAQL
jgi:hypothetical protein